MDLEVLISTMNQNDHKLLDAMNIQSNAVLINQCDFNKVEMVNYKGHKVKFMSLAERGVGLSRNTALMFAEGDICLMADDDMVYVDGYRDIVLNSFRENPKADMIMFNVPIYKNGKRTNYDIVKKDRVRFYNSMKYGTVHIAFRRSSILRENIYFNLLFGGGS